MLQQLKLENTYSMEPDDKDRFHPGVVEKMLGNSNSYSSRFNPFKAVKICRSSPFTTTVKSNNLVDILERNIIA